MMKEVSVRAKRSRYSNTPNQTKFIIVLGLAGSGKSNYCLDELEKFRNNGGKTMYINPYPKDEFSDGTGAPFINYSLYGVSDVKEIDKFIKLNTKKTRPCLCVIDDCRQIFKSNTGGELVELVNRRRHYGLNLIFIFHSFTQVPPELIISCTHIVAFKQPKLDERIRRKIDGILTPAQYERLSQLSNFRGVLFEL